MTDPLATASEAAPAAPTGERGLGPGAAAPTGKQSLGPDALATAGEQAFGPDAAAVPARVTIGARQIVSQGLDLSLRATPQLRPASIYVGLQLMALAGPLVILVVVAFSRVTDLSRLVAGEIVAADLSPSENSLLGLIFVGAAVLVLGFAALAIDSQSIATSLLAGQLRGKPVTLAEAVIRARQAFWRLARATFMVGIASSIVGFALGFAFQGSLGRRGIGANLATSFVDVIVVAPFCYALTGIVLGDVGAVETLKRSVRLARARWRAALVIGLFAVAMGYVEVLASGAGADILDRLSRIFGLGFDHGSLTTFVTIVVVLVGSLAFGSLLFTMYAIVAAPQVVAFVGLTGYTEGLDRARATFALEPQPVASTAPEGDRGSLTRPIERWGPVQPTPSRFRWVTIPMALGIALSILISIIGIIDVLSNTY